MTLRRPATSPRRGTSSALVIIGLANPGADYEWSRHNVGGDAVRAVARRHGVELKIEARQRCWSGSFDTPQGRVTLAVPTTFMNESGAALPPLLRRVSVEDLAKVLVAHDELDMEPGRLQLKMGGGLAGHNGLRSIAGVMKSQDFSRLRIGVGKPARKEQGGDWVLKRLTGTAKEGLVRTVEEAADALELVIEQGFEAAQRIVNAGRAE